MKELSIFMGGIGMVAEFESFKNWFKGYESEYIITDIVFTIKIGNNTRDCFLYVKDI